MSAITIIDLNPVQIAAATTPCKRYVHKFRVDWDKNEGAISYPLQVVVHFGLPEATIFELNIGDITFEDSNTIQFEKEYDIPRRVSNLGDTGFNSKVLVSNPTGTEIAQLDFNAVSFWSISNIQTTTNANNVTTATSFVLQPSVGQNLFLQSSLDDITYTSSNTQIVNSPGDYTFYVRDAFGCTKSLDFTASDVPIFTSTNDYHFITLLNSVGFSNYEPNELPNIYNTLSYAEDVGRNYMETAYNYPTDEVLKLQFRSNYDVNEIHYVRCGESYQSFLPTKVTTNLNQSDIRDMQVYRGADNFLRAFNNGTGNIYENDGGFNAIGTNDLDGTLIVYQQVGDFVDIDGLGVFEILEIQEIDGQGQTLKLNFEGVITDGSYIVTTYYSLLNYEVYEFDVTIADLISPSQIGIVISSNADYDAANPLDSLVYLSEEIVANDDLGNFFKFVWQNSENNQMIWQTGIVSTAYYRKLYNPIFEPLDNNEIYTTDTRKRMLEGEVYETHTFVLDAVPTNLARQISLLTSSDSLIINGLAYVKEETPEITPLVGSNLYTVSLKLTLADNYNSNSDSETEEIFIGQGLPPNGFLQW